VNRQGEQGARVSEVVIIGAGISGAATAWELARSGWKVTLLDRWGPAAMASGWTLAGVRQSGRHPAELPLAREAVGIWKTLAEQLDGTTHYRRGGNLRLARTPEEVPVIRALVDEQKAAGLDIVFLDDPKQIRDVAPAVSETVLAASLCSSDGHADPQATVESFVRAAERAGARLRFGERALSIETEAGRVTGVRTDKDLIPADRVVLAAGIFGNELLQPLGLRVPLEIPMVTLLRSVPMAPMLEQVIGVANADCAGRQEANGRLRVTSGLLPWDGGMDETPRPAIHPTAASIVETVRTFGGVIPAFREARIEAMWAGLIDLTPDALPVIEAVPQIEGLVVAMGFSGHGFCLGPVTGRIVAALVQGETPSQDISPFTLARFAGSNLPSAPLTLHG
jgi:sarcosine oxidase subunit beta